MAPGGLERPGLGDEAGGPGARLDPRRLAREGPRRRGCEGLRKNIQLFFLLLYSALRSLLTHSSLAEAAPYASRLGQVLPVLPVKAPLQPHVVGAQGLPGGLAARGESDSGANRGAS